jgi:predicted amidophosphoribosyltransferase
MPIWCPDCNAMLAEGTPECPRCGAHLSKPGEDPNKLGAEDIFNVTLYVMSLALIPIGVVVIISLLCIWAGS